MRLDGTGQSPEPKHANPAAKEDEAEDSLQRGRANPRGTEWATAPRGAAPG